MKQHQGYIPRSERFVAQLKDVTKNALVENFELEHFQFGPAIEGLESRSCKVTAVVVQPLENKTIVSAEDFGQKSR